MRIAPTLIAVTAAALVACGTVAEKAQPAAPAPAVQAEPAAPVAAEPAPAPEPVVQAAPVPTVQPAPKRHVKAVKVARRAPIAAPPPAPAKPAGPTDQEIAAALALVDQTLARTMLEQMRFTTPNSLKRDATGAASLEFGSIAEFEKARQALAENVQVRNAGIRISSRVQGRLAGENIGVKAGSPESQEVTAALPGQWKWQLQPSAEGKAKLHLVVSVETTVAGNTTPRSVHTVDREVTVEAGAPPAEEGSFLGRNWWWMLIALVVAAAGAWFARRKA